MTTTLEIAAIPQHIVLPGMSWAYYEQTLAAIGNRNIRVAFLDGVLELMSPLPEHDAVKLAIGQLISFLATERGVPFQAYGSATFRREEKSAGAEPDGCFYFGEIDSIKGMKRFDPLIHRAPDFWIEVDLFSSSVAREVIYARLGVPEVWRYSGDGLAVRLLDAATGLYVDSSNSKAFPFLPMREFEGFIPKMLDGDQGAVLREFLVWVGRLPR